MKYRINIGYYNSHADFNDENCMFNRKTLYTTVALVFFNASKMVEEFQNKLTNRKTLGGISNLNPVQP